MGEVVVEEGLDDVEPGVHDQVLVRVVQGEAVKSVYPEFWNVILTCPFTQAHFVKMLHPTLCVQLVCAHLIALNIYRQSSVKKPPSKNTSNNNTFHIKRY